MPFVRFSRDKRGYEHIYLVHAATRHGKPSRPHILYWYRTPPGVTIGREPFDEPVRRALEAQNPEVSFDWKKLASATIPPPDVEHWRERRRVERAAKQARLAETREPPAGDEPPSERVQVSSAESAGEPEGTHDTGAAGQQEGRPVPGTAAPVSAAGEGGRERPNPRRRRRHRGRRRRTAPATAPPDSSKKDG